MFTLPLLAVLILGFGLPAVAPAGTPPPADDVFGVHVARAADGSLVCTWAISPGYHLYRERIGVGTGDGRSLPILLPDGEKTDDPTLGVTQLYHGRVTGRIPASALPASGDLRLTYQGCAEQGVCYPPVRKRIDLASLAVTPAQRGGLESFATPPAPAPRAPEKADGALAATLAGGLSTMS